MIISRRHNFIFIKTRKTAGSSMEFALASHAGPDDLVTPFNPAEELERYGVYPNAVPRNYAPDKALEAAYREAIASGDNSAIKNAWRALVATVDDVSFGRHGGAKRAKRLAGEALWNAAYKFTIERHPYEKAVSLAWFGRRGRDFSVALAEVLRGRDYRNFNLYSMGGKLAVDFIVRHERLAEDVARVEQALGGLDIFSKLPRAKSHQRLDNRPAREVLTDAQKEIVQETCREEFALFGYEP
jgi:hypothetical protein